jgi:F-type H+-transporting ATPase subunit gamma
MKGQDLKRRINGIEETVKITKAMHMISASKMHKVQQLYDSAKKFVEKVASCANLVTNKHYLDHKYLTLATDNRSAFIVIAGDKGLCGDYNNVILEKAFQEITKRNVTKVFPIGYIARDFFKKRNYDMIKTYIHLGLDPIPEDALDVAQDIIKRFLDKEFDKVYIAYTDVITVSNQKPVVEKLLPIPINDTENEVEILTGENSIEAILNQYILAKIYYALISSSFAINYKRMIAMQQSTTNGEDIISELKLQYNHKRQESITTELVDASASLQGKRL